MNMIKPYRGNLCSRQAEKMISIKINNNCNRSCSFCVDRFGRDGEIINVDKISKNAIDLEDYKTVIITGGEPFLNLDKVIELAKNLRTSKNRIVLNTNGSLLTRGRVDRLEGLIDEIQVSIHHFNEGVHGEVLGGKVLFSRIKKSLENRSFIFSVNSTFNNYCAPVQRKEFVSNMIDVCSYIGADKLRLTELKKVDETQFVDSKEFFHKDHPAIAKKSSELIARGCTYYYKEKGIDISVKRLCEHAKGENAKAFSCCFIDVEGQKKIDIDTKPTFKVIYSDGLVTDDWVFNKN